MKVNEKLFICLIRVSIIIDTILSYSVGRAIIDFLKVAATPFIISTLLSLLTLFESEKWNTVLIRARDEFIQVTGLKLSFYIIIILVGFSFIVYSFDFLTKFIARFVILISDVGFIISAVLTGVVSGVLFSEFFGVQNGISGYFKVTFYIAMFFISAMFYISSKGISDNIKNEFNNVLENKAPYFIRSFGAILAAVGLFALFLEPWNEVFK